MKRSDKSEGLFWSVLLLAAVGYAASLRAEVQSIPSISSTSTSAPVQLPRAATDLTIINDAASANESYIRVFVCGEPILAAVAATAPAMRLEPGNSVSLKWTRSAGGDGGYCALTHVTAAAETATLRVISQ